MREKHNTSKSKNIKTKIISLITAIALWLYVIAVVDPSEKKIIEHIPITITNLKEIRNEDFVIYPREDMETDITLEGKLSEIQKLNKNNVHIYGEVINPVEGQNIVNLRTNISNRISRELRENTFVINLEKKVEKKVPIKIEIPKALKGEISDIEPEIEEMQISGARTLINQVKYLGANLETVVDKDKGSSVEKLELKAYNSKGDEVNLALEKELLSVKVNFIVEKAVPIKLKFEEGVDSTGYESSPEEVVLYGSVEDLKDINSVYTEPITEKDFESVTEKKIKIKSPPKIEIKGDVKEVTVIKK